MILWIYYSVILYFSIVKIRPFGISLAFLNLPQLCIPSCLLQNKAKLWIFLIFNCKLKYLIKYLFENGTPWYFAEMNELQISGNAWNTSHDRLFKMLEIMTISYTTAAPKDKNLWSWLVFPGPASFHANTWAKKKKKSKKKMLFKYLSCLLWIGTKILLRSLLEQSVWTQTPSSTHIV